MQKKEKEITLAIAKEAVPKRDKKSQKWDFGHCLIVAGSSNLFGAALMAAKAALRSGAGLVTLAVPASLQSFAYAHVTEALTLPLEEEIKGVIGFNAAEEVLSYISKRRISSLVIGPGLGCHESTMQCVATILRSADVPVLVDADGINASPPLKNSAFRCITPHYREFARLIKAPSNDVLANADALAKRFIEEHPNVALALKGAPTKVFYRSFSWVNKLGNPGMAKGGCGDVLSGIGGALLAQQKPGAKSGESLINAVLASVFLHSLCGDIACKKFGEYSMTPTDMIDSLPEAFRKLED
ncbi:NAD(P)H-hydrate dehydratase [Elusimicrobiota bacterium]